MKEFFKSLIVPVATYGVLRGGEALVNVIRNRKKNDGESTDANSDKPKK